MWTGTPLFPESASTMAPRVDALQDLLYAQTRDQLALRAEIGLFQDLQLHVELPVILNEVATLAFDQSAELYRVVDQIPEVLESVAVGQEVTATIRNGLSATASGAAG